MGPPLYIKGGDAQFPQGGNFSGGSIRSICANFQLATNLSQSSLFLSFILELLLVISM
jgi:hypothetical protein